MDGVCWSCFFLLSSFFPPLLPPILILLSISSLLPPVSPLPLLPLFLSSLLHTSLSLIPFLCLSSPFLYPLSPFLYPLLSPLCSPSSFCPSSEQPHIWRQPPPPSVPGAVPAVRAPPSIREPTAPHRAIVPRWPPGCFPPHNPASPRCRISPGPGLVSREGKPCPARGDSPQNWVQGRLFPLPPCDDAVGGVGNNTLAGTMSRQPGMRLECQFWGPGGCSRPTTRGAAMLMHPMAVGHTMRP